MTEQQTDRDALRKLADAATPGPWEADYSEEDNYSIKSPGTAWGDGYAWVSDPSNAEFIAAARTAVPQLLDQLDQAEAELDSWMTRAYEAEKRAWQAEARIKHLEDTAQVLAKEALKAEAERDAARGYISELETAVESRNDVIKHRDARIKAVRDLCDDADKRHASVLIVTKVRRALESVPPPSA